MSYKKNQTGFAHLMLLIVAVVVVAGAIGWYVVTHQKTKSLSSAQLADSALVKQLPDNILSIDKVKELATTKASGRTISAVMLVKENSDFIYKIRLDDGTVLVFNALTGDQLNRGAQAKKQDQQETETENDDLPGTFTATVSFDQARAIALNQKPDGVISKIELESEDGKVVYNVRFTDGTRINIDANSGVVVSTKVKKENSGSSHKSTGTKSNDESSSSSDSSSSDSSSSNDQQDSSGSDNSSDSNSGSDNSGSDSGDSNQDDN